MQVDRYYLDAIELVMMEDFADTLDDAALSAMVISTAEFLAHTPRD